MPSTAQIISPAPRRDWEALLRDQPGTPVESTPAWLDCMRATGGFVDASRLYRFPAGRAVLVPMAIRRLGGRFGSAASWPFDWGFGGIVTGGGEPTPAQARAVLSDLAAVPAVRTSLAFPPGIHPVWLAQAPAYFAAEARTVHDVDLDGGYAAAFARFRPRRRTSVRKAERIGIEIEADRRGRRIPEYYGLFEASIERWAKEQNEPLALCRFRNRRANSRDKLAAVARTLGERCTIWVAWVEGRPAAAIIVLRSSGHDTYWHSAVDHELATRTRAIDLLMARAIADACAAGSSTFAMGESRSGSALAQFKAGFGAKEATAHLFRRERVPLARAEHLARAGVKRAIGFRDR